MSTTMKQSKKRRKEKLGVQPGKPSFASFDFLCDFAVINPSAIGPLISFHPETPDGNSEVFELETN